MRSSHTAPARPGCTRTRPRSTGTPRSPGEATTGVRTTAGEGDPRVKPAAQLHFLAALPPRPAGDPNWRLVPWTRPHNAPAGGRSRGGGSLRGSRLAFSGGEHTGTTCTSICSPACCRCSCKVDGTVRRRGHMEAPESCAERTSCSGGTSLLRERGRPGVSQGTAAAGSRRRGEQRTTLAAKVPFTVGPLVGCRSLLWRAVHHKEKWPRQTQG